LAHGTPFLIALPLATLSTAAVGAVIVLPALRMSGLYLAIATLAFAIIVEQVLIHWEPVTGGFRGMAVESPALFGHELRAAWEFYYLCLALLILVILASLNLLRAPTGRAMIAIRDSAISAQSLGVDVARTKTVAFALSAGLTGLAGGLFAHKFGYLAPDAFNLLTSIQLLVLVVVGGLGSIHGAIYGAIFIGLLPQLLAILRDTLPSAVGQQPGLEPGLFGLILVLVILFEPMGIHGRWIKIKAYLNHSPEQRKVAFKRQKAYIKTERLH
jgi:branched-chain amino acid transport system permease protein